MIRIALGNAMRAGVQDDIVFEVGDYLGDPEFRMY
jgi:23S rRNA G2445 N2-methylase RlmL